MLVWNVVYDVVVEDGCRCGCAMSRDDRHGGVVVVGDNDESGRRMLYDDSTTRTTKVEVEVGWMLMVLLIRLLMVMWDRL